MRRLDRHFSELERTIPPPKPDLETETGQFALDDSAATQIGRPAPEQPTHNVTQPARPAPASHLLPSHVAPSALPQVPLKVLPSGLPPSVLVIEAESLLPPLDLPPPTPSPQLRTAPSGIEIPTSEIPAPVIRTPGVSNSEIVARPPPVVPPVRMQHVPPPPVPQRQVLSSVPLPTPHNQKVRGGSGYPGKGDLRTHDATAGATDAQPPHSSMSDSPTTRLFPDQPPKPQTILGMRPAFLIVFLMLILAFFVAYYFLRGDEFIY